MENSGYLKWPNLIRGTLIKRMDAKMLKPADHIDPAYGKELRKAVRNGVEIIVYDVFLDLKGIRLNRRLLYVI